LAADQEYASVQCNLGVLYETGVGVSTDAQEAVRLYLLAAEQGREAAQYNLGACYQDGKGVTANCQEAFRRYHLAADKEYGEAQRSLGLRYQSGIGVALNTGKPYDGISWWLLSKMRWLCIISVFATRMVLELAQTIVRQFAYTNCQLFEDMQGPNIGSVVATKTGLGFLSTLS
jgi:head-tail adaptor